MHPSLVPQHPDRWARANAGHANDEDGAPFAPLAGYAVRIRAGAGFASHHWDWYDPPYWIGGVFLVLSRRSPVPGRGAIALSRVTCDVLPSWDWRANLQSCLSPGERGTRQHPARVRVAGPAAQHRMRVPHGEPPR